MLEMKGESDCKFISVSGKKLSEKLLNFLWNSMPYDLTLKHGTIKNIIDLTHYQSINKIKAWDNAANSLLALGRDTHKL